MDDLKSSMASLLAVDRAEINLDIMVGGLSHETYRCRVSECSYFIKKYNNIKDISKVIKYINKLTQYMCERGIPASRVSLYSPVFANIVVHEFVEGEMHSGEFSQLKAIAELYSKLVLVGMDHSQYRSSNEYFAGLHSAVGVIRSTESQGTEVDGSIHMGMLKMADEVLKSVQRLAGT